ncbi:hypothetical protein IFM89_023738 [Coptis chinensis]|uniref:Uncharacterized protein n=1 Tax=Coptis chinensis TaxID=261450 RepID=A0A835ICH8_9MAGN|nr:hypothetical protein IFM89_023738 [Coptis chinensis]
MQLPVVMCPYSFILHNFFTPTIVVALIKVGTMAISPKKHGNDIGEGGSPVTDEKAEPIVAFSKPPHPPVMGPFLVLSLLEMVSGHDKND